MKTDIHPVYEETHVTCSCGNSFTTRSTKPGDMHVELCNECHPFFTGKQKLVDSGGRVERFQKRYGKTTFTKAGEPADEASEPADTADVATAETDEVETSDEE